MSKCREAFEQYFAGLDLTREQLGKELAPFYYFTDTQERWEDWQAAWNARGKVDADLARNIAVSESANRPGVISAFDCAEAIEQEQCK